MGLGSKWVASSLCELASPPSPVSFVGRQLIQVQPVAFHIVLCGHVLQAADNRTVDCESAFGIESVLPFVDMVMPSGLETKRVGFLHEPQEHVYGCVIPRWSCPNANLAK